MKTGRALMDEVLSSSPPRGGLDFWWLGQLGYIIRLGGVTLLIDGYFDVNAKRLHPPLVLPEALQGVDYVLGTHDHSDHIDHEAWKTIARHVPQARFVVPALLAARLGGALGIDRDRIIGIDEGESPCRCGDLTIEGVAAAHETLDRDPDTGLYPYTGYVISGHGVSLYHSGDCVVYEGLETKLLQRAPLDVMFLPINGRDGRRFRSGCIGNMTYQEAVGLVCALRPGLAVPGHYDMFANNLANPMDFADYLEAKAPDQAFWIGGHGVRVQYRRGV